MELLSKGTNTNAIYFKAECILAQMPKSELSTKSRSTDHLPHALSLANGDIDEIAGSARSMQAANRFRHSRLAITIIMICMMTSTPSVTAHVNWFFVLSTCGLSMHNGIIFSDLSHSIFQQCLYRGFIDSCSFSRLQP